MTRFWINDYDLSEYAWHVVRTPRNGGGAGEVIVTGPLSASLPSMALTGAVGAEAVVTIASGLFRGTLLSLNESVAIFSINEEEAQSAG